MKIPMFLAKVVAGIITIVYSCNVETGASLVVGIIVGALLVVSALLESKDPIPGLDDKKVRGVLTGCVCLGLVILCYVIFGLVISATIGLLNLWMTMGLAYVIFCQLENWCKGGE